MIFFFSLHMSTNTVSVCIGKMKMKIAPKNGEILHSNFFFLTTIILMFLFVDHNHYYYDDDDYYYFDQVKAKKNENFSFIHLFTERIYSKMKIKIQWQ